MTPERWQQVKAVFEAVRDLPENERAPAIESRCSHDPDLLQEIRSLLAQLSRATGFLEMPAVPARPRHSSISAALDEPSPPPETLGPYRVERELGRGGMGVVYLARDPALDRAVALKMLPEGLQRDRDRLLRFEREARILASLNHPNIAAIYNLEQAAEGTRFLVLEYVPGRTMSDRLESGPLKVEEALHACAQVCRGLEAAHGRGVIHRDLKPDNIRITPEGLVKILDFGLARRAPDSGAGPASGHQSVATRPGLVLGTPGYMSPEQARGQPLDERTDVFSFACVLYACLTGQAPFQGQSIGDSLAAVLREEADLTRLPADAPARVRDLLTRCLAKDTQARVRDIALVRREIETAILEAGIGVGSIISAPSPFASVGRLHAPPTNNLPRQLTSFVGRERELGEALRLLDGGALLTLTGAGGCGKTRLALRIAADLLDRFPGGVWLVELATLADPALVPAAAASVVGVKEEPGRPLLRSLVERLEARRVLLILDNCEHILNAAGQLAQTLLQSCPDLKIIVTSREGLGIPGETAWRVPSLSTPAAAATPAEARSSEAVRLFIERAKAVKPEFELTDAAAPHVARICARLDGIPLAIELAAARVKVLSVEQISAKLSDRFRLLVGGSRTALERHQTLRAAIDWSYGLLSDAERGVLRVLSVFVGGCTLDAAVAVYAGDEFETLDLLTHLVDKSLVVAQEDPAGGEGGGQVRYRLLETVRQYARDKLQSEGQGVLEAQAVCERHAVFFLELAEKAEPGLVGKDQQAWLERLGLEHENLLAALEWCAGAVVAYDTPGSTITTLPGTWVERGLRLAGASGRFWGIRGHLTAGRAAVELALARDTGAAPTPARGKALNAAGSVAYLQGDTAAAERYWESALVVQRQLADTRAVAGALNNLGLVAAGKGDNERARRLYSEALATNRSLGNRAWEAININNLGNVAWNQREYAQAKALYLEALALNREVGNRGAEAQNLNNLGATTCESGDDAGAREFYREALRIKRELGDKTGIAVTIGQLGILAAKHGDTRSAAKLISDALLMRRELGDKQGIAMSLEECAVLACAGGEFQRACRMYAAADALRAVLASPLAPGAHLRTELGLAPARAALSPEEFAGAWKAGQVEGWGRLNDEALAWLRTHAA